MARVVMKFGGTSVADLDRMRRVARHVKREREFGNQVVVTVSAMAGETNRLIEFCDQVGKPAEDLKVIDVERDAVVATGEQVSSGLLALILQNLGIPARSWHGWQIKVHTNDQHGKARISDIDTEALSQALDDGTVCVVAGFQGVTASDRVSTLGRGGSDTTAVALAAALGAERCDIYTDVDGVYTTDPRITKTAKRIDRLSFEEMLEMASLGAKVLQTRSVELAMAHNVHLRVLSSFQNPDEIGPNTVICDEDDKMEQNIVSAVTLSRDDCRISLLSVPDEPGRAAFIFQRMAELGVNIDMIIQSPARATGANISFTLPLSEMDQAETELSRLQDEIGYAEIISDRNVSKVSVIGVGMRSHAGVASLMFKALAEKGINIHNISTSEIKISVLIDAEYSELAVRALHTVYGLDGEATASVAGTP
ncbi:MAG: aspartate kinase [Pseudomonadota bacterium]